MDGEHLQGLIYKGYGKAALRTGQPYDQYRFASAINPISRQNNLGSVNCLFASDANFSAPVKYKIPDRYLYADGTLLAQRDILVGPYGTFYVGDMQPNLPMKVVRCNDSVSITRLTYSGVHQVLVQVATAMPAFKQLKKVDQKSVTGVGGASTASTAIGEFFLFLPVPQGLLQQNDIITDEAGVIFTLDTIDNTEVGVVLTMHQASNE